MAGPASRRALCSASRHTKRTLTMNAVPTIRVSLLQTLPQLSAMQHNHPQPSHPRLFSTTPLLARASMGRARPNVRNPIQPASNIRRAEAEKSALASGDIPDDVGLLGEHFVPPRPFYRILTSLLKTPRKLWVLLKKWGVQRVKQQSTLLQYKYYSAAGFLKHRAEKKELPGIALQLYRDMYEGFAKADVEGGKLEGRLCEGLKGSLGRRIKMREGEPLRWKLVKEAEKPQLVSYVVGMMPLPQGQKMQKGKVNAVIQVVVRIRTLQAIGRMKSVMRNEGGRVSTVKVPVDDRGRELADAEADLTVQNAKEMVEYFVLQRTVKKGSEGPWKGWGMAKEVDVNTLAMEDAKAKAARKRAKALGKAEKAAKSAKSNVLT